MCADVRPALADWAAGRLSPPARHAVERHLRTCADCRALADDWSALAQAATAFAAAAGPPPLWRSPSAAAGAVPVDPAVSIHRPVRPRRRAVVALAAIAAAVAIVSLGAGILRRASSPDGATAVNRLPIPSMPTIVVRRAIPGARLVTRAERSAPAGATDPAARRGAPARRAGASVAAPRSLPDRAAPDPPSSAPPTAAQPTTAALDAAPAASAPPPPVSPRAPIVSPVPMSTPAPPTSLASTPSPAPPTVPVPPPGAGIVTGIVTGPDGFERAEVDIVALPFDATEAARTASTGATGAFTLTLPAGPWSIHAESPAYLAAWPDGALTPLDGAPVDVVAGDTAHLRFMLPAASWAAIRGRVVDVAGVPVDGALVLAAAPDTERGGYRAFVAATFSDAGGRYALAVDEGAWLVAAATDWRAPHLTWWGGDGDLVAVDRVSVWRERPAEGIDIRLREPGADGAGDDAGGGAGP